MEKKQIITIAHSMGFHIDLDEWDTTSKGWIRFELKNRDLDESELRLIWYKEHTLGQNLHKAAEILFKAGQKYKIQQLSKLEGF
jgi:hypothetical protein